MIYAKMIHKVNKVMIIMIIIISMIIIKLFYAQFYMSKTYMNQITDSWQRSLVIEGKRGRIYDCNHKVLVDNMLTSSLIVVPSQIVNAKQTALILSGILQCDEKELLKKLTKKVSVERVTPMGRQLDEEIAYSIDQLKLPGIYLVSDSKRYYPYHHYLSHTLGFVGRDNQGLVGLELKYNDYLLGEKGSIDYYMDGKGNNIHIYPANYKYPTSGYDMILTIDTRISDVVERELNNAYQKYNPDSILALAMDPRNGKILAISSKPDFDPNNYQESSSDIYNKNLPIWKSYEPGSTFKIITFASALNENLFDMDQDTYYDKGYEIVGGARIKSWKAGGHGLQTFRQVLMNSSNPGFVEIGRRLNKERLYKYIEDFGLNEKTGIDLPGESKGIMFDYDNFNEVEQATVAFGQGLSLTPLQLVRAICACVNGGYLYQPYVVDEIIDPKTKDIIYKTNPKVIRQVINQETSLKMRDALESVVSEGGGKNAYIDGYRIGGKTGTAQKAVNGTYANNGYILSFVGIAPIDDPQIVLYIALDNPKNTVQYGGTTVAPIARNIFSDVLPALNIKKDMKDFENNHTIIVKQYIGLNKKDVKSEDYTFEFIGEGNQVIDQFPKYNDYIKKGEKVKIYLGK